MIQECQASDECHGPGSAAPPAAALPTFQGTGGNYEAGAQEEEGTGTAAGTRHKHRHQASAEEEERDDAPGFATVLSLCALAPAASAQTATAVEPISSFGVTTSTTAAGAHPDLTASFTLEEPGEPEAAENVTVNLPQGVFGNPNAIPTCTVSDFALFQCPMASQAGTVAVRANYLGNPERPPRRGARL